MISFLKRIYQILRQLDLIVYYIYYATHHKVMNRQVLFLSQSRSRLDGNFEFIASAIRDDYLIETALGEVHDRKLLAYKMAVSHYIIVDDFCPIIYPIPLRHKTQLIQVWHALGAFKTVGYARKGNSDDRYSLTHRNYSHAIVSSPAIVKDYALAFHMKPKKILPIGIPRSDVFFHDDQKAAIRASLYEEFPLLKGKKVILFAPTFRGNNVYNGYYDYNHIHFKHLQEALGDDYVCIIKMHPFVQNHMKEILDPHFFIDLSSRREINDLLMVTDILITDYSSVIFEAALLPIKTIFFAYDLEEYIASRDFFYPYSSYTYGPVVKNEEDLITAIREGTIDEKKKAAFIDYFMSSCDGHATTRFVHTLLGGQDL